MSGNEDRNSLNVTFDLNEDSKTSACRVGPAVTLKVPVICTNSGGFGPGSFQQIFGVGRLGLSRRVASALSRFGPISIGIGIEAVQGRGVVGRGRRSRGWGSENAIGFNTGRQPNKAG